MFNSESQTSSTATSLSEVHALLGRLYSDLDRVAGLLTPKFRAEMFSAPLMGGMAGHIPVAEAVADLSTDDVDGSGSNTGIGSGDDESNAIYEFDDSDGFYPADIIDLDELTNAANQLNPGAGVTLTFGTGEDAVCVAIHSAVIPPMGCCRFDDEPCGSTGDPRDL